MSVYVSNVIPSLIRLEAITREVHWNVRGPGFISIHRYLDEVYASAEAYIDEIAEHVVAFYGMSPTWSVEKPFQHFRAGVIPDGIERVVTEIDSLLEIVDSLDDVSRETEDILVRLSQDFHKHRWFLVNEISE